MSTPVADEFDEIRARMNEIRAAEVPMCPVMTHRTLHDCLRSPAACAGGCPHSSDWIDPEPTIRDDCCF